MTSIRNFVCAFLLACTFGCTSFHYEENRLDGTTITANGGSLFKDSGIDDFVVRSPEGQSAELRGYKSTTNQQALQATVQAVVQGAVSALKLLP